MKSRILRHMLAMLLLASLLPVFCGCSRRGGEESDSETIEADSADCLDTVRADSGEVEEEPYIAMPDTESLMRFMRGSGQWERYASGILPQMAADVPEYCERLLNSRFDRFIIVDKGYMKVYLYDRYGNLERSYGMACARNFGTKHKKGDSRTPEGFFSVEGRYNSTDWLFTDDDGVTSPKKGQFGPRFIRLDTPRTRAIGIHGTCAPWSIGGRSSHGCIRIKNEEILELVELVEPGMPVIVSPGSRDMRVNAEEGYDIPSVATVPGRARLTVRARRAEAPAAATDSVGGSGHGSTDNPEPSSLPDSSPADTLTAPDPDVVETLP